MTEKPDPGRFPEYPKADPWQALSYIAAGVLFWGFVGWLLARWTGVPLLTGAGILLGGVLGIYLIWLRYGRPRPGPPMVVGPAESPDESVESSSPATSPPPAESPGSTPSASAPPTEEDTP
jgi:ATP synthase protein I